MDSCNVLYVCAEKDPKMEPGGCPISRRQFKTEINYLGLYHESRFRRQQHRLLGIRLLD